ncbi:MAG: 50S ribosome-binding GTPase [Granulosicoccus sp.]|nr:50S ribosome-binding GTPase [Granulosicoccus sp.]
MPESQRKSLARMPAIYLVAASLAALPVGVLSLAGIIYLQEHDLLLAACVIWLIISMIVYAALHIRLTHLKPNKRAPANNAQINRESAPARGDAADSDTESDAYQALPARLEEQPYWSTAEKALWGRGIQEIETLLEHEPSWDSIPVYSMKLLSSVCSEYEQLKQGSSPTPWHLEHSKAEFGQFNIDKLINELRFSLPELLLVFSTAADRYRTVVLTHIPFAEEITIATTMHLYRKQRTVRKGARWINYLRRTIRLINPASAVVSEIREQITNRMLHQAGHKLQTDLKRLLFQELLQVAMDLNSGRLKNSSEEIAQHLSSKSDSYIGEQAAATDPLRIVLLGQINSGKSSLINALVEQLQAETDVIPTTDSTTVYSLDTDDGSPLQLVDTEGLQDTPHSIDALTKVAIEADLIIHLAKANQPARAADRNLCNSINAAFEKQALRRRAATILLLTHADQLNPKSEWTPPYDLGSNSPKATNILNALRSALEQIGLDNQTPAIPACLSSTRGLYNVGALADQILLLEDQLLQTQLNRRRLALSEQKQGLVHRWNQLKKLGHVVGQSMVS